jgi:hypothetical protein
MTSSTAAKGVIMDKSRLEEQFAETLKRMLNALNSVRGIQEGLIAEYPELFSQKTWLGDCIATMASVADVLLEQARTDSWNGQGPDLRKRRRVINAWLENLKNEFASKAERDIVTLEQACNILVRRAMEYAKTLAKLTVRLVAEAQLSGANA